jgi:phosphoribosylformylglycinamidine synthase
MVKAIILRAPGTNCDVETAFAFQQAGAEATLVHVNQLIRREQQLANYQIMVIPGGFTYGDDIAAGKVLANELRLKLGEDIIRFIEDSGHLQRFSGAGESGLPARAIQWRLAAPDPDHQRFR